jgi:hypothetical protein
MKKVDNNSNEFIPKIGDFGQGISLHNFIW